MKPVRYLLAVTAMASVLVVTSAFADVLYPAWVNQRVASLTDWVRDPSKFTIDPTFTPPIHNQSTDMNNLNDGAWRVFTFRRDYYPAGASVTFAFRHDPATHVEELWEQNFAEVYPVVKKGIKWGEDLQAPKVLRTHWSYSTRQGSSEGIQASQQTEQRSMVEQQKQMLDQLTSQRRATITSNVPTTARIGGASCRKIDQGGSLNCGGWGNLTNTWSFSGGATLAGCPAGLIQANYRETADTISFDCFAVR